MQKAMEDTNFWKPDCTEICEQILYCALPLRMMILLEAFETSKNDLRKCSSVYELLWESH